MPLNINEIKEASIILQNLVLFEIFNYTQIQTNNISSNGITFEK